MNTNIGFQGKIGYEVINKKGDIVSKVEPFKNIILNQGLDAFGGNFGGSLYDGCAVGSGTSEPAVTQTNLDNFVARTGVYSAFQAEKTIDEVNNRLIISRMFIYEFKDIGNHNLTEIGLTFTGTTQSTMRLGTRTLIKDSTGNNTVISLKSDETLRVYYTIYAVYSLLDRTGVLNYIDGNGVSTAYNYIVRPAYVDGADMWPEGKVGEFLTASNSSYYGTFKDSIKDFRGRPTMPSHSVYNGGFVPQFSGYIPNSLSKDYNFAASVGMNPGLVKSAIFSCPLGYWQIEYSKASDGTGFIIGTSEKAETAIKVSWGRYDGVIN